MCSNLNANNNESTVFGSSPSTLYFYTWELITDTLYSISMCSETRISSLPSACVCSGVMKVAEPHPTITQVPTSNITPKKTKII